MIEFNLLPDVKMQYLRTRSLMHSVVTASFIVGGVSLAIFILLLAYVDIAQKVRLNNLTNQINTSSSQLSSNTNLNQILTVQKQLETIPQLETQTPTTSRLFGFLSQLTPSTATIANVNISFTANNVTITGAADSLATVNTYVDTLKFTTFDNVTNNTKGNQAFSAVVLSSFNYSSSSSNGQPAQYTITFNFDPNLFNSADSMNLIVPSETTTRSILNQPTLFEANPKGS